jgi:ABC-type transport system involved in cytochrome c biogenesis permease component
MTGGGLGPLLWKDARRELRGKESIAAGFVLVLLFFVLDLFAFPTLADAPRTAAAVLWTPLLFASGALAGRAWAAEADRGTLDLLRSAPVPLLFHGLSRWLVNLAVTTALALAGLAVAGGLFAIPLSAQLAIPVLLGAVGLSVLASLAAALGAQARARDVLLPILLVPLAAPLLQSGLAATLTALAGQPLAAASAPLLLMAGYDLVALGVSLPLWPILLEGE